MYMQCARQQLAFLNTEAATTKACTLATRETFSLADACAVCVMLTWALVPVALGPALPRHCHTHRALHLCIHK
jgi:hypothetical protein